MQNKTGARLVIPIHPELHAVIDGTPKDNMTFLTTSFGKPFTAAGSKDRSEHGLHKAAARQLAEAGRSAL